MNEKLDPDEDVLEELFKVIEDKQNKKLDDELGYDTYSK